MGRGEVVAEAIWSAVLLEALREPRKWAAWLLSEEDGPGTFRWTCHRLKLDPGVVREATR
jgi:hypothetical protein